MIPPLRTRTIDFESIEEKEKKKGIESLVLNQLKKKKEGGIKVFGIVVRIVDLNFVALVQI